MHSHTVARVGVAFFILFVGMPWSFAARSRLYPESWELGFSDSDGQFIHDFSYAGYHNGAPVPPDTLGVLPVFDAVGMFGADNSGALDAAPAIQQAIDAAQGHGGGIVHLAAGTYRCDSTLTVSASRIILRGAGSNASFVYFSFVPEFSNTPHILFSGNVVYTEEALLTEDAPNLSFHVKVEDASGFSVGDDIAVGWIITEDFVEEHGMTGTWYVSNGQWRAFFRREITSIDTSDTPHVITLDVPLRYPAKVRDSASIRKEEGYLSECGVQDLALSNAVDKALAWSQDQIHVLAMRDVKDSYICRVTSFQSPLANDDSEKHLQSSGILLSTSKRVTVAHCRMEKAQHRGSGGNGYLFEVRQSNEVLYEECIALDGRHNFIQNWDFGTSGIVWLRCSSAGSTAITLVGPIEIPVRAYCEYHHSLAMACLVDSCTFADGWQTGNRGSWSSGAGHTATQTVIWNTRGLGDARILSFNFGHGYVIGTESIAVHVDRYPGLSTLHAGTAPTDYTEFIGTGRYLRPQSLYKSQRNRRLGLPEPPEEELPPSEFQLAYVGANPLHAILGTRAVITVEPIQAVEAVQYQWYRVVEDKTLESIHGATESSLVFEPVRLDDAGIYVCSARDAVGEVQSEPIQLIVELGLSLNPVIGGGILAFVVVVGGLGFKSGRSGQSGQSGQGR